MAFHFSTVSPNGDQGTPQGSGDRYQSLSTWSAAQSVIHTVGDISEAQCYKGYYGGDVGLKEILAFTSFNTDNGNAPVTVSAAPGSEVGDRTDNDGTDYFYLYWDANNILIQCDTVPGFTIKGIRMSGTGRACVNMRGGGLVDSCTAQNNSGTSTSYATVTGRNDFKVRNCILVNNGAGSAVAQTTTGAGEFYNVLGISGSGFALNSADQPSVVTNCVFKSNSAVSVSGTTAIVANTTISDSVSPGTNWDSATLNLSTAAGVDFVDFANADYTPADGGKLKDTGQTIGDFSVDINGLSRPQGAAWDQGPIEAAGAAPGVTFDGPDIVDQAGTEGQVFSFDENGEGTVASRFTGATSYAYAPGSDQPAGITVNPVTGNLEGTPTESGVFNVMTIQGSG